MRKPEPDRREQLLDAAVELLRSNGLHSLTQPQVARHAGVTQSHLTYYFPRRSDLLAAVAWRFASALAEELAEHEGADVEALVEFATRQVHDRERTRMLVGLLVEAEGDPALHDQLVQNAAMMRAAVGNVINLHPEDPTLYLLQATVWGLAVQFLLIGGEQPLLATRELLRGLGNLAPVGTPPAEPTDADVEPEPPPRRRRRK